MNNETQIIEINGVKLEVDLRYAKRVDHFRVGTKVKILEKQSNYGGSTDTKVYSGAELKFAYVNTATDKKWEIVAAVDDDLPVQKQDVLSKIDREIQKKRDEIMDIERKRDYFLTHFAAYFAHDNVEE